MSDQDESDCNSPVGMLPDDFDFSIDDRTDAQKAEDARREISHAEITIEARVLVGLLGTPAMDGYCGLVMGEVLAQIYGCGLRVATLDPLSMSADRGSREPLELLKYCRAISRLTGFKVLLWGGRTYFELETDPEKYEFGGREASRSARISASGQLGWNIQIQRDIYPEDTHIRHDRRGAKAKDAIPQSLRTAVFERDSYRCVHCGSFVGLAADHIYPECLGGPTVFENLQALCKSCNSRKGGRLEHATIPPVSEGGDRG